MLRNMHKRITMISFGMALLCIILSTIFSMFAISHMGKENQKEMNLLLAARVHDSINSALTEPIMAAKTMAYSQALIDFLSGMESADAEQENVAYMQSALARIKAGLGYDSAFVVSSGTNRYYTYDGLNKIVDPVNDPHDVWYSIFLEKNKEYDLDVDVDEVNGNVWTVFVNARVMHEGKTLGVCGVGVQMTQLQETIAAYEREYGVKINLIDANGLVQVDTDAVNIEAAHLEDIPVSVKDSREYVYTEQADGDFAVSKYVDNLGWYLVVQSRQPKVDPQVMQLIIINAVLFLTAALVFVIFSIASHRRTRILINSSYYDQLTGLQNRRAYEESLATLNAGRLRPDLVCAIVDLNGLKKANDSIGHAAGDEIIKGAAQCIEKALSPYGEVFRIGGDEFAALLKVSPQEQEEAIAALRREVDAWEGMRVKELSVSVGCAARRESKTMTLQDMVQLADKRMYEDKKAWYALPGNDRRRR
ncbi:MAG: sensor domain-containing diguanylate cyclase [Clostridia bacterium]|nr:sensor domain-containing diguanylate cyclase [Clostridia bacterium]